LIYSAKLFLHSRYSKGYFLKRLINWYSDCKYFIGPTKELLFIRFYIGRESNSIRFSQTILSALDLKIKTNKQLEQLRPPTLP